MLLSEPAQLCAAIGTAQLWKLLNRIRAQPRVAPLWGNRPLPGRMRAWASRAPVILL